MDRLYDMTFSSAALSRFSLPRPVRTAVTAVLAVMLLAAAQPAEAQQWRQTATVMADVKTGHATRAFIDTVANRLRKSDTLMVRRSRDGEPMRLQTLQDSLVADGVGLQSANRMFIDYEFQIVDNELIEEIQDIQLIFRPPSTTERDISVLYLDAEQEMVADVMRESGVPDESNVAMTHYFVNELSFPALSLDQNVEVVSAAGRDLREGYDQRRKVLMRQMKTFIYDRDKVYHTRILADQ